jgi:peptidoglycan/xylan/chitin deacetylase (PgdA/CDA1 family)
MYHRVAPDGAPAARRWRVTPAELDAQLAYLRGAGYHGVGLDAWVQARITAQDVPGRAVAITFDDGYADFEQWALPVLERHGFGATVFAVTDLVGATNAWDRDVEDVPLMDWDALRRIAARGIEIGAHTATHPALATLDDADVVREVTRSRTALRRELGRPATAFAFPYGSRDVGISAIVGACGFDIAVSSRPGLASRADPLLDVPRVEVSGGMSFEAFVRGVSGT